MSKRYFIIAVLGMAVLIGVVAVNRLINPSESPQDANGTITIKEGTQYHFGDIAIGLGTVRNDSAWFEISKEGEGSSKKTVGVGDKFEVNGYMIEVKSMKPNASLSLAPGSSNGYVTLLITKQETI